MPGPTVTIDLIDYDKLRNERQNALNDAAQQRQLAIEAKLGDPDSEIRKAVAVARAAVEVARYAMGHLSPEFAKKWPYNDLRKLADGLTVLPGVTAEEKELADEMRSFAVDCETWERTRATETMRLEADRIEKANLARIADLAGSVQTRTQAEPTD